MHRASVFLKVEIEFDEHETPERIGEQICRQILKMYGVRTAELSSVTISGD